MLPGSKQINQLTMCSQADRNIWDVSLRAVISDKISKDIVSAGSSFRR
jgi:hypothetical protein